ncbi:unnamed protein product [Rotaria sp. Silwood2]|nr:unnamed protein product [Rotaria sp. Silwood2]
MKDLAEIFVREHEKMMQTNTEILFMYQEIKMTSDQIEKFKENDGKLVSMNGFLTTTTFRSTALKQVMKPLKQTDLIHVLLELQFNLQHLGNRVIVAETSQYNEISCEEQEDIICNSNVTFRLESVIMKEQMHLIKMSASNEDLAKIERSLDEVLQWKEARKYYDRAYNRIMNIKSIRIKDLAYILFDIGEILHLQGRYEEAREYFE